MKNRLFLFIIAVLFSTGLVFSFGFVVRSEAQADTSDKRAGARPAPTGSIRDEAVRAALPDLDVTFIERQPMYFSYCVEYHWGETPGMPGRPYVCPGSENERRWPDPGEVVTFTAHIVNKGDAVSPAFGFAWQIDGVVVSTGMLPALNPGESVTTPYTWPWAHGLDGERLTGTHTVGFSADPAGLVDETFESNNNLTDRTDAVSFQIVITPQMVLAYNEPINASLPRSAEDWFQKQVKAMNNAFSTTIYPATPAGAVTQVRINRFVVRDTPINGDRSHDGGWFVDADYRLVSAYYDQATDIDWAWIHEMSHQMALIDHYVSNVEFPFNHVLNREGLRMNIGFAWPATNSIMFGGDTSPYTAPWVYDSHTAGGTKSNFGYRNGFYGAYQFDIPLQNSLRLLDSAGQPAAGVEVSLYRKLNLPGVPADLDNTPEISGITDINGLLSLPNLPANGGTTTPTDHSLHPNPFGMVDIVGEENRYLVKIVQGEHEEFQWLDITAFNLAYWQGNTDDFTHTIQTHLPIAGAPPAPPDFGGQVEDDMLTIHWSAGPASVVGYNVYRMGPPDYQYVKVSTLQNWTWLLDFFYNYPQSSACFYVVTAVDNQGRESGFSPHWWLPRLSRPVSVVLEKNGDFLVQDSSSYYNFPEISPFGRWLRTQPITEMSAYGTQFFTINPDGWLVISMPTDGIYAYTSLLLYNPQTEGGFLIGNRGAGQLQYPTGVAWWGSQGYSVEETHQADADTLLLAHFDGSFNGSQGETGTPSGVTFSAGKYGQAASFDGSAVLTYPSPGNVVSTRGGIEFWTRPNWNGNDNLGHTFIEVNETWENRIKIAKDGANNLRFLIWDGGGSEYGVYCPIADWKAGDWHHVAATWQEEWMMLAVDGVPCKSTTQGGMPLLQDETIYVGNSAGGNEPTAGLLDELRISYLPRFGNTDQLRILAAEGAGQNRVVALDGLGNLVTSFGSSGSGNNQFNNPRGLTLDSAGNVIVVDRGNNRVQVLGFNGTQFTYQRTLTGGFNAPTNAAAYMGWLVVADSGNNQVKVLDPFGNLAGTYTEPDAGMLSASPFLDPQGVAIDRLGEIIVADTGRSRVVRIAQNALPKNFTFLPFARR